MKTIIEFINEKQNFLVKGHTKDQSGAVDLDLPSGLKWATCNIGADKPEDYGLLFQFGCTKGYKYEEISPEDIIKNYDKLNKYNGEDVLPESADVAYEETKGRFRTPTKEECEELLKYTDTKWTNLNGIKGMKFMSKKDNEKWIFIPAGGWFSYYDDKFKYFDNRASIMSVDTMGKDNYYVLYLYSRDKSVTYMHMKSASSVRGVLNK